MGHRLLLFIFLWCDLNTFAFEKCENSQRTIDGPYRNSNILLAKKFVRKYYPDAKEVKIGVIDSGFDEKFQKNFKNTVKTKDFLTWTQEFEIEFKTGIKYKDKTSSDRDEIKHGSSVISIIGDSKIGINENVKITSYKTRTTNVEEKTMNEEFFERLTRFGAGGLFYSIKNSCDDGNEITNLSMSTIYSEQDQPTFELISYGLFKTTPLHEYLYNKGCLVYMSSGNSGVKYSIKKMANFKTYPSIKRVGSLNRIGLESSFSSNANVYLTGENVVTLIDGGEKENKVKRCKGNRYGLKNGTSFSSPILVGAQSLVLSILKTSKKYTSLKGREKIDILNRIMENSMNGRGYDALFAVNLASRWVEDDNRSGYNKLQEKKNRPFEDLKYTCHKNIKCEKGDDKCLEEVRLRDFYCYGGPSSNLMDLAYKNNEIEWMLQLLFKVGRDKDGKKIRSKYKEKVRELYFKGDYSLSELYEYYNFITALYEDEDESLKNKFFEDGYKKLRSRIETLEDKIFFIERIVMQRPIRKEILDFVVKSFENGEIPFQKAFIILISSKFKIDDFINYLERIINIKRKEVLKVATNNIERKQIISAFQEIKLRAIYHVRFEVPGREKLIIEEIEKIKRGDVSMFLTEIVDNEIIDLNLRKKYLLEAAKNRLKIAKNALLNSIVKMTTKKEFSKEERVEIFLFLLDNCNSSSDYMYIYLQIKKNHQDIIKFIEDFEGDASL